MSGLTYWQRMLMATGTLMCRRGLHEMTPENVGWNLAGHTRYCRACANEKQRERRASNTESSRDA